MKKILILFPKDWDYVALNTPHFSNQYQFYFEGFNLFRFPENVRLLNWNALSYIEKIEKKYRAIGLDGVVSNDEQFGCLIAAILAERLGLPGNKPEAIIVCQHKLQSRLAQKKIISSAVPQFCHVPYPYRQEQMQSLTFPLFIKPIKATYSVLAKEIRDAGELQQHVQFNFFEETLIRKLVQPFLQIMPFYLPSLVDPNGLIAEEIMDGRQLNIDGYCIDGKVHFLGLIDEVMYPQTRAFMRFEYPSQLPDMIQSRAKGIAEKVLNGIGYCHGFFNIELIYDENTDDLKIIEINPRMASQLVNLYDRVDGVNSYSILFSLAVGEEPHLPMPRAQFGSAASFIFRSFNHLSSQKKLTKAHEVRVLSQYPDLSLMQYRKKGAGLKREIKWLGSHRYAVLNLGGNSRDDLFKRFQAVCTALNFDESVCKILTQ